MASNWAYILIALLAFGCWHYRGSASDWQKNSQEQEYRAHTAEDANSTLATANATLNIRNKNLVESLNARTEQLTQQRKRADANRAAYRSALDKNPDWGSTRVPDAVARSLRTAAGGQDNAGNEDPGAR